MKTLLSNVVEVWEVSFSDIDVSESELIRWLSPDEKQRAAKYVFDRDRNAFVTVRGLLRRLLAHYLEKDACAFQFHLNRHGKPYVHDAISFNVSHTTEAGLIAFTSSAPIGVDIEKVQPDIITPALIRDVLSHDERRHFMARNRSPELFFEIWTAKEAYFKAMGIGLAESMSLTTVYNQPVVNKYRLFSLNISALRHKAALAVKGDMHSIVVRPIHELLSNVLGQ